MNDLQNQDKFTEKLHDKVYDYAEAPAAQVWDKLNERLDAIAQPERKKRMGWIWVAATLLLTLVGAGFWLAGDERKNVEAVNTIEQPSIKNKSALPSSEKSTESSRPVDKPVKPQIDPASTVAPSVSSPAVVSKPTPRLAKPIVYPAKGKDPAAPKITQPLVTEVTPIVQTREQLNPLIEQPLPASTPVMIVYNKDSISQEVLQASMKQLQLVYPNLVMAPVVLGKLLDENRLPAAVAPLSIVLVNNVNYSVTRYQQASVKNQTMQNNAKLTNAMSEGRVNYSTGFSMGIKLTDRLMASAGVRLTKYSEKYSYNISKATSDPFNFSINNPGTGDPLLAARYYKNAGDSIVPGNTHSFVNHYYCNEVPITLTWYIPMKGKWNAFLDGGISMIKVSYARASYVDADRVGFIVILDQHSYPGFQMMFNLNMSMGVSYRFNPKFSFEVAPSLRYGLNSMIKEKTWTQQTPSFVGVNIGVRRHF